MSASQSNPHVARDPAPAIIDAPPAAAIGWLLPEWNDLSNEQRGQIVKVAEYWSDEFAECLSRDAAVAIYDRIREVVHVEPPPLLAALTGQSEAMQHGNSGMDK